MDNINIRQLFKSEVCVKDFQRRNIGDCLKKLKDNGDDLKIKHVKKLYQIYIMFYQTLRLLYCEEVFNGYVEPAIDNFYDFLIYTINNIKGDIYKFITEDESFR